MLKTWVFWFVISFRISSVDLFLKFLFWYKFYRCSITMLLYIIIKCSNVVFFSTSNFSYRYLKSKILQRMRKHYIFVEYILSLSVSIYFRTWSYSLRTQSLRMCHSAQQEECLYWSSSRLASYFSGCRFVSIQQSSKKCIWKCYFWQQFLSQRFKDAF